MRSPTSTSRSPPALPGRPFSGFGTITGQGNGQGGREHGQKTDQLPGYRRLDDPAARRHIAGIWGIDEQLLPVAGKSAYELLDVARHARSARCSSWDPTRRCRRRTRCTSANACASLDTLDRRRLLPVRNRAARRHRAAERAVGRGRRHDDQPRGPGHSSAPGDGAARRCAHRPRNPHGHRRAARARRPLSVRRRRARSSTSCGARRRAPRPTTRASPTNGSTPKTACSGPAPTTIIPGTPRLFADRFPTPTGRARFHATPEADVADPRDADYPAAPHHRPDSRALPVRQLRRGASPSCMAAAPEPFAEMHPRTARLAGVADGSRIALTTRRAAARFKARLTRDIREDTVFVPFHWTDRRAGQPPDQRRARSDQPHARIQGLRRARRALRKRGHPLTAKARLVVIGNGMAGARFVEDVLARGGRERFDITVFGDEPHGNYNRILLSGVLAGTHTRGDISINPLAWYAANGVTLHAGARVERLDLTARRVIGRRRPVACRSTRWSSRPAAGRSCRPSPGCVPTTARCKTGAFVFRTLDDCERMLASAPDSSRSAAVIGGGLLGIEAARGLRNHGLDVHVVHLMTARDGRAARSAGQPASCSGSSSRSGSEDADSARRPARARRRTAITGVQFARRLAARVRHGRRRRRHPAQRRARRGRPACAVNRGILVGDDLACPGRTGVYAIGECAEHRGQLYGLVAPLWEQARVLADRLTGRHAAARLRRARGRPPGSKWPASTSP